MEDVSGLKDQKPWPAQAPRGLALIQKPVSVMRNTVMAAGAEGALDPHRRGR